jgi:DNA-binding transcriptional LysR family regulator
MYDWAEFRHFRYLLSILELQGFRAAAEKLHTAQPNLSIQAKQFQEAASVQLYERLKDGRIKPTRTGEAFKLIAKYLLDAREEAMEALVAIENDNLIVVRFGCSPLADPGLFSDLCQIHKDLLPSCSIHPERHDTTQLIDEVISGSIDAAIVTRPVDNSALKIEDLCHDRLVVCLRADHPLASKNALQLPDIGDNLRILYHPERHPSAHQRLLELLRGVGIQIGTYSRASHPLEMQSLVKDGYGFALVREGVSLDSELTTRPIVGVDWTVDTALIYRSDHYPKTIPVVIRQLKRQLSKATSGIVERRAKIPSMREKNEPIQLELLSQD